MRKVYVLICTWEDTGKKHVTGVFSSWKKANEFAKKYPEGRTYEIKTEILL